MSLALYRTYRPGTLAEVVGQEHVTEPLARALAHDRVHHAYLFSGPRGCGKTSTARILARSLNCEQGPTPDPCGVCASCRDLAPNGPGSLDVIELDAASHGGVDDTRDLRERAMFAPASSRYKVYIVDEAHMVSPAGFNALLKLVEEPPEHVRFIFATTEAEKVLPTIRSRTHNYAFRLVPTRILQEHLARVSEAEGVPADPTALALVARSGGGSVRDALSLLGQLIAGSGPDGVTYPLAVEQLGVTDAALLDATVAAIAAQDGAALFSVVDRVVDVGHDPRRFATDLLQRLRDLIVLAAMPADQALPLLDAPDSQIATMREQVAGFSLAELSRAADLVSTGLSDLKGATAPRLHLELMVARLLLPASDDTERGLAARLDSLERQVAGGPGASRAARPAPAAGPAPIAPPAPADPPPADTAPRSVAPPPPPISAVAPTTAPVRRPPSRPESGSERAESPPAPPAASEPATVTLADIRTMWPAVLEALKAQAKVPWMVFQDSTPLSLDGRQLAVGVADAGKVKNIPASGHDERLRQVIIDVLRADLAIDVVLVGTDRGSPAGAEAADAPSIDDADTDSGEMTGESLAIQALGATVIGEIEQR